MPSRSCGAGQVFPGQEEPILRLYDLQVRGAELRHYSETLNATQALSLFRHRPMQLFVVDTCAMHGVDGTGWKTSLLKVFPSRFCNFLALLYREWWSTRAILPQFDVDVARQWLNKLVQALPTGETTFGPGFNKRSHR